MCGIAGFVNLDGAPADASVLGAMADMIRHRGQDDRGTLCLSLRGGVPDTALGFQRLKIVDLSAGGHQPMTSPDGSTALLFNGEIYGAYDHKAELARDGYRFRTGTDPEIILALYECGGPERMLERLDGTFAIVIADTRRGVAHLLRDRVGIKPLSWVRCGTSVLFASEAKALLAHPAFRAEIDSAEVDELLAFRYVAGQASLLKGVRQVQPGHRLTITPEGVREARYWSIPDHAEKLRLSREDAVDRLGHLRAIAVAERPDRGVPVVRWRRLVAGNHARAFTSQCCTLGFTVGLSFCSALLPPGQLRSDTSMGVLLSLAGAPLALASARLLRVGGFTA
jgi:asparagine synthase (glutamine-hydrolysing)